MRVLQIIDNLNAGGAEKVAVNIANELLPLVKESHLCCTREQGVLNKNIDANVKYLFLERKSTRDMKAIRALRNYIKDHNITHIHAHGSSFFITYMATMGLSGIQFIWHDHYGLRLEQKGISQLILKQCSIRFTHIIAVSKELEQFAKTSLKANKVKYLANFITDEQSNTALDLPGKKAFRMVQVANIKPNKNQVGLVEAFAKAVLTSKNNDWMLFLVGKVQDASYMEKLRKTIANHQLEDRIHVLGAREDVLDILNNCSVGIIASKKEGLPISLLEYGIAGLHVIATSAGQCPKVLDNKGVVVNTPNELSKEIHVLMKNKSTYQGDAFRKHILDTFGARTYMKQLIDFYSS